MSKRVFYDFSAITFVERDDPTYGTFKMQCVGIVDYLGIIKSLPESKRIAWFEVFHPFTYFKSCGFNQFELHSHVSRFDDAGVPVIVEGCERVALFIPTKNINKDWDFHACKYGKDVGGAKLPFPLSVTDARIARWQNSLPNRMLVPEWLDSCQSYEDLFICDQVANTPCLYCCDGAPTSVIVSE